MQPHHLVLIGQLLAQAHLALLEQSIAQVQAEVDVDMDVDVDVDRALAPCEEAVTLLDTSLGGGGRGDRHRGRDRDRYGHESRPRVLAAPRLSGGHAAATHPAAGAGLCPGNKPRGGKRLSGKIPKGIPKGHRWLRAVLAAGSAGRSGREHRPRAGFPTDVWVAGTTRLGNGETRALIEQWDGRHWHIVAVPLPAGIDSSLSGMVVLSRGDVWAVGTAFTASGQDQTLAEHWDGRSWRIIPTPNPGLTGSALSHVAALSSHDVWAVGESIRYKRGPLVGRWNGVRWGVVPSPALAVRSSGFTVVVALSARDVWALGPAGSSLLNPVETVAAHWDGTRWQIEPFPRAGSPAAAAGLSAADIWVVSVPPNPGLPQPPAGTLVPLPCCSLRAWCLRCSASYSSRWCAYWPMRWRASARARAELQGQPMPTAAHTGLGLRVRWETALFVAGVVGFLVTLSTAGRPGLSASAIVSGLMVLIGAGMFVARG